MSASMGNIGNTGGDLGNIAGGIGTLIKGSPQNVNPNQQPNINNANATYETATGNAQQTMNTAQALNSNSQNTLNTALGQETPMVSAVNNSANQNLSTYGSTFTPLQQTQAQNALDYTSDKNVQQREGMAVADQNAGTQAALANQRAALAAEGVDPASVHGSALTQEAALTGAANAAGAANQSVVQGQLTGAALQNQANQIGLGVGGLGTSQASTGSGIATQEVGNQNTTNNSNINDLTAANTYLNTANGANANAIGASSSNFNEEQQNYENQIGANASQIGAISGVVAGMGNLGADAMPTSASMARGGPVSARGALPFPIVPGTTDTKLAALTPGEFVIPKDVTQHLGHEKLHKLIDKTREEIAERRGIPMHHQLSSAHVSQGV
jgi:hypothetical protein